MIHSHRNLRSTLAALLSLVFLSSSNLAPAAHAAGGDLSARSERIRWSAQAEVLKDRLLSEQRARLAPLEPVEMPMRPEIEAADHLVVVFHEEFVPEWNGEEITNFCGSIPGAEWRPRVPASLFARSMELWSHWEERLGRRLRSPLAEFLVRSRGDVSLREIESELEALGCVDQIVRIPRVAEGGGTHPLLRRRSSSGTSPVEARDRPIVERATSGRWWLERLGVRNMWKSWGIAGRHVKVGLLVDGAIGAGSELPNVQYAGDVDTFGISGSGRDEANARALAEQPTGSLDEPVAGIAYQAQIYLTSDIRCDATSGPTPHGPDPCSGFHPPLAWWQDYAIRELGQAVGEGGVVILPKTLAGFDSSGNLLRGGAPINADPFSMAAINEVAQAGVTVVVAAGDGGTGPGISLNLQSYWPNVRDSRALIVTGGRNSNGINDPHCRFGDCATYAVRFLDADSEVQTDLNEIHTVVAGGLAALAQSWYRRLDFFRGAAIKRALSFDDLKSLNYNDLTDRFGDIPKVRTERTQPEVVLVTPFPELDALFPGGPPVDIGVTDAAATQPLGTTVLAFNDSPVPATLTDWRTILWTGPDPEAFRLSPLPASVGGLSGRPIDVLLDTDQPGSYHLAVSYALDPSNPTARNGFDVTGTVTAAPFPKLELRTHEYRLLIPDSTNAVGIDHGLREDGDLLSKSTRIVRVYNWGGEPLLITPQLSAAIGSDGEFSFSWEGRSGNQQQVEPGEHVLLVTRYHGTEVGEHSATLTLSSNDPGQRQVHLELTGRTIGDRAVKLAALSDEQRVMLRDQAGFPADGPLVEAVIDFGTLTTDEWGEEWVNRTTPIARLLSLVGGEVLEAVLPGVLGPVVVNSPQAGDVIDDAFVEVGVNPIGPGAFQSYYDFVIDAGESQARLWFVGTIRSITVPDVVIEAGDEPSLLLNSAATASLTAQEAPASQAAAALAPGDTIYVGSAAPGEAVSRRLRIVNNRNVPIAISELSVGSPAFEISIDQSAVAPGASTWLTVGFHAPGEGTGTASTPAGFRVTDGTGADHFFGFVATATVAGGGGGGGGGGVGPAILRLFEECSGTYVEDGGTLDFARLSGCSGDHREPLRLRLRNEGGLDLFTYYYVATPDLPAYFEFPDRTGAIQLGRGDSLPLRVRLPDTRTQKPRREVLTIEYWEGEGSPTQSFQVSLADGGPRQVHSDVGITLIAAATGAGIAVQGRGTGQTPPAPFHAATVSDCRWAQQTLWLRNEEAGDIEVLDFTREWRGRYHLDVDDFAWPGVVAPGEVAELDLHFIPRRLLNGAVECPASVEPASIFGAYRVVGTEIVKEFEFGVTGSYTPGLPILGVLIPDADGAPDLELTASGHAASLEPGRGSTIWIRNVAPDDRRYLEVRLIHRGTTGLLSGSVSLEAGSASRWRLVRSQRVHRTPDSSLSIFFTPQTLEDTSATWADLAPKSEVRYILRYTAPSDGSQPTESLRIESNDGNPPFRLYLAEGAVARIAIPWGTNDLVTTVENQGIYVTVLDNDSPDLAIQEIATPADHGAATASRSGIIYIPDPGFVGSDRFEYVASNEEGATVRAWVTVIVEPNVQPPVAVNDHKEIGAGMCRTINVTQNDYDPDGGSVYLAWDSVVVPPQHGTATGWGQQIADFPPTVLRYCPDPGFVGIDGFRYRIHDGYGSEFSAEAWVTVEVIDLNLPPVALTDEIVVRDFESVTLNLTANDYDVDGGAIRLDGTSWLTSPPSLGSVTRVSDTSVTYTPAPSTGGFDDPLDNDSFSYRIVDATGKTAVGTVRLRIKNSSADPAYFIPPWTALDTVPVANEVGEGPTIFSVLANDSSDAAMSLQSYDASGLSGQLTLVGDQFSYQPVPGHENVEIFTYVVSNTTGSTVRSTGTVELHHYRPRGTVGRIVAADEVPGDTTIPQLPPLARPDQFLVLPDSAADLDVLANDSDENGDPIQVGAIPQQPAYGNAEIVAGQLVRYTPNFGFFGNDSFLYSATDGGGSTTTAVSIYIPDPDSPPAAGDDVVTTLEDTPVLVAVLTNDQDWDGDPLRPSAVVLPPEHGTATIQADGTIRYTPEADWFGTDRFEYLVTDDDEGVSVEAAEVAVTVVSVNDPPTLQPDEVTTLQDTQVTIRVLANDSDPEGAFLKVKSVSSPQHGTASHYYGSGSVVYTPDPGYFGTDSFTYRVDDGGLAPGQTGYGPVGVTVTVEKDNHAPITRLDEFTVSEEVSFGFFAWNLLADDVDPDGDELSVVAVGQPSHGTLLHNDALTSFSYRGPTDWCGLTSAEYTVSDGYGGTAPGIIRFLVRCVNDPPVAGDDAFSVTKNSYLEIPAADLLANDSDVEGGVLTVGSVGAASHGTVLLQAGGSVRYDPTTGYDGPDTFSYVVRDDDGAEATGQVAINVLPDYPPVARFSYSCSGRTCDFTATATTDDAPLTHGSYRWDFPDTFYTWDAVGATVRWTFETGGSKRVRLQVTDSANQKGYASQYLEIVEPPPVAVDDFLGFYRGYSRAIYFSTLLANDSDPGGDALTVIEIGAPDRGTIDCSQESDYCIYHPPYSLWRGLARMTYTISDGHGETDSATLVVEYY